MSWKPPAVAPFSDAALLARSTLEAVVGWRRFAELFAYDEADQTLSLEPA